MSEMARTVEHLDEPTLRRLYHEDHLTDAEIAKRYGTYQVKISRLRRKWGIKTLLKSDRLELPPLTEAQCSLVIGSLLGDGHMVSVGKDTASLSEGHCVEQASYTKWKASIMGEHVTRVVEGSKREGAKEYKSLSYHTHASRHLRPYYDMFYRTGTRVFPSNLYALINPFILAVWYMDDGTLARDYHPKIVFGLDDVSRKRAARALRVLGLKPQWHEEGSFTFPGQSDEFFDIVRPHVPRCMAYKLPKASARRDRDRNAKKLTPEKAESLYEQGNTLDEIASAYGVGRSTVRRRLQAVGKPRRRMGRPRRKYSVEAAEVALGNYDVEEWKGLSEEEQRRWVEDIYKVLTNTPFPYPSKRDTSHLLKRVQRINTRLEGDTIRPMSWVGLRELYPLFPNRYKAKHKKHLSAWEAWRNEKALKQAIRFQLTTGDPVVPHRVLRAVQANCRTPTAFRPAIAKYVYETYASPGESVWDPTAGYGGRLLGAMAAGVQYIGTDVEPKTVKGNLRLAKAIGQASRVRVECHRAEDFDPGPVELVFTSPPYFDQERYSGRKDQSWQMHGSSLESWLAGFLRPVVATAYRRLPKGRHLVINIADVRAGRTTVPLVSETQRVAREVGFEHVKTLKMPLAALNRKQPWEPVLIFRN